MMLMSQNLPLQDDPLNERKIMNYVKRSPASSKDGRISVTEESKGVAPCSYEPCQNYYQFISLSVKSYPSFVRSRCGFVELLAAARVLLVSVNLAVQGMFWQQPGEHHYWTSEKQAADSIYNQDLRQRGF